MLCRRCASRRLSIRPKSYIFCIGCEVLSVRAADPQVIDVLAIVAEDRFRPDNGRLTGQCALILR